MLWWLGNTPDLSEPTRALISEPENTIFVGAVSLWEIWLKESLGKLRLSADFEVRMANEPPSCLAPLAPSGSV
jgi:PIN domain nuclease of toxin-antitoxin system